MLDDCTHTHTHTHTPPSVKVPEANPPSTSVKVPETNPPSADNGVAVRVGVGVGVGVPVLALVILGVVIGVVLVLRFRGRRLKRYTILHVHVDGKRDLWCSSTAWLLSAQI